MKQRIQQSFHKQNQISVTEAMQAGVYKTTYTFLNVYMVWYVIMQNIFFFYMYTEVASNDSRIDEMKWESVNNFWIYTYNDSRLI